METIPLMFEKKVKGTEFKNEKENVINQHFIPRQPNDICLLNEIDDVLRPTGGSTSARIGVECR